MTPALDGFHKVVRAWFERRFGVPSHVQRRGWPAIASAGASGHDVLLCAPTGSGKTLAAFMWAINRLVTEAEAGTLAESVSVLYVSPLKALANDIRLNLDEPLDGVKRTAVEFGLDLAAIRAGLRTGDTPAHERSAMLRRPPQILVTTPESLFILLTSPRFREKLAAVRYLIVDELHAIAGNKRGAHLMLTLERLERLVRLTTGVRPVRIGLSATLNPIERMAAFIAGFEAAGGERSPRPVEIVRADGDTRRFELQVSAPGPALGPLATHQHWEAMYDEVARLIGEHRTTLVFTLSRRWAERIALNLQKRLGADAVMAHHGSLARRERLAAEQRLKRGELKAIVATASLELGIDVGAVDLVCQIDSPKSISAAIQRIGRSGHRLGAIPEGRFFAMTLDDLLECAAAVRAVRAGVLDEAEIPGGCLDVVAQQIIAIAAEEEEIGEADLLRLIRAAYSFGDFDDAALRRLLDEMTAAIPAGIRGGGPKIFYDRINGRVRARKGARIAAITSGGTIPESGNYDVVIESQGRKIGDVEEDFAQESSRGDIFALGSMPWRILRISKNRLMVEPAPGMAPTLPFWQTEAAGRSRALCAAVSELRDEIVARLQNPGAAADWLAGECALDMEAARQAVDYVRRGAAALDGAVPDQTTLIIERFFDGLGGAQIVIHSPFGIRLNRGFGLALRKRLCQSFDFEIQASAIDDAVLLALNARHSFPLTDALRMLPANNVAGVLTQAILDAPMFEVRFRHVASRALAIMRSDKGRRIPAWIQRLRAQELIAALFPGREACFENRPPRIEIPAHFIVGETLRECLEESADLPGLKELLERVESGAVRVVTVDSIAPSVFAHRILLAWDYSFLDDGERANRRSRSVTMNRAMSEDVLRTEDLSEMLARDAIAAVEMEVSGRASSRRARNRDELLELVRAHGFIEREGLAERTVGDPAPMLDELQREKRIVTGRLTPVSPLCVMAAEDCGLFAAAFLLGSDCGRSERQADEITPEAAREEIVRRALATSGPTTISRLSRFGLPPAAIQLALIALESKGAVFRGHFMKIDGEREEQWCDRYNLERIHRQTLARLRTEIQPCADHEFAAFRLRWSHIGGLGAEPGAEGVRTVLERLGGLAFSAEFWERAIFPARIPGYRFEYLDRVCLSGEFRWAAIANEETASETPARVAFLRRRDRLAPRPDPETIVEPKERAVWFAVLEGGAQYLDEIAERANLSEPDALRALWRLAASGFVSNDSFAPLRLFWPARGGSFDEPARDIRTGRRRAAMRARLKSSAAGRWSALRRADNASEPNSARETAIAVLAHNGIVAREMLQMETSKLSWSDVAPELRRLEYAGAIRRGYFVASLSGEQYALPEALEVLTSVRGLNPARERPYAMSAADPANPYGVLLPSCAVAREPSNVIVIRGGKAIAGMAGRTLRLIESLDDSDFNAALTAINSFRGRLVVENINDGPALNSVWVDALAAMGFHSDGRALVYDGLPGPRPAKSAASISRA